MGGKKKCFFYGKTVFKVRSVGHSRPEASRFYTAHLLKSHFNLNQHTRSQGKQIRNKFQDDTKIITTYNYTQEVPEQPGMLEYLSDFIV